MQKIVATHVRKVSVETAQPRPPVRSSKRSEEKAQMVGWTRGERRGRARAAGVRGRGRQVFDWRVVSVVGVG